MGINIQLRPFIDELFIVTKSGRVQRLGDIMNAAQADLIAECERQLRETGQIRIIVLKARQLGLSTVIEAVIFALTFLSENFGALIMSHEAESSEHLLKMTSHYWETFIFKRHFRTKYDGKKTLSWTFGGHISVGTAGGKGGARSRTIRGLHGSEVAFWPEPERLWTGLRNTIPTLEGAVTAIFLESTANGVGNYFYHVWNAAVLGENEYTAKFYPWHEHPEYVAQNIPEAQRAIYADLSSLDEEERMLVDRYRLGPERLIWRRWAIQNLCTGKDSRGRALSVSGIDQFHQEYPCNPHEAFISSGLNVFNLVKLLAHYKPWLGTKGRLVRDGGRVRFDERDDGPLTIFVWPSDDPNWGMYQIGADPTHTVAGDYACAQVIHRRTLEQVAVLRQKCDPVTFADQLELLGYFYNMAVIATEGVGPGYGTIGALMAKNYPMMWRNKKVDKSQGQNTDIMGWNTNRSTKHFAIQSLVKLLQDPIVAMEGREYGVIIHDEQTLMEMRSYVSTPDGQGYENGDGSPFDDGVMALAIAYTTHMVDILDVPAYEPPGREAIDRVERVIPAMAVKRTHNNPTHSFTDPTAPPAPRDPKANDKDAPWEDWDQ